MSRANCVPLLLFCIFLAVEGCGSCLVEDQQLSCKRFVTLIFTDGLCVI